MSKYSEAEIINYKVRLLGSHSGESFVQIALYDLNLFLIVMTLNDVCP